MPQMVALKELYYEGQTIAAGARFELREGLVRLYEILKRAKKAPAEEEQQPAGRTRRRAMLPPDPEPEPPTLQPEASTLNPTPEEPPPAGRYARRDLRAVDTDEA